MREPQEIEDEEHEQIWERVAAVDVAKASGMVCIRVPHPSRPGRRVSKVWEVEATTGAIAELGEQLAGLGIQKVTVESTSDYWRPFLYLLEAAGLSVQLVNAREVKNVPGRPKTDKLDAVWLAKLTERGMLRPSFVPPAEIRQLRDYTRLRLDRSRHVQRLEKLLEDALIKLSTVATDIMGKSGRAMLEALTAGERDPGVLAGLARGRMRGQARRAGAGPHRPVRRPPRRARPDAAGPVRRPDRPDRPSHRPDRGTARRDSRRPRRGRRRHHRPRRWQRPPRGRVARRRAAGRGPRHRTAHRAGAPRRARPGHGHLPHPRPPGVVGQAVPTDHPVRKQAPRR